MKSNSNIFMHLDDAGALEKSKNILLSLIEHDPTNASVYYQCGSIMNMLGFFKESIIYFEKSIEYGLLGQELEDVYLKIPYIYVKLKDFKKALVVLEESMKKYPKNNSLKILYAITLYQLQRKEESFMILLEILISTTSDQRIVDYKKELQTCLTLSI